MNKKNLILYSHAGSKNHGCEAIVRSTTQFLREKYKISIMSSDMDADIEYGVNKVCDEIFDIQKYKKNSIEYLIYALKYRINKKKAHPYCASCWQIKNYLKNSIAMSIGGDNYCYLDDNMEWLIEELITSHKYFYKKHVKTVLWGCSIEEKTLKNKRILNDLKKFDLITVRETMSAENLEKYGLRNNVVLTCDSAFHLNMVELPLPKNFIEGKTIGINISPMVIENEKVDGIVLKNYLSLVDYILSNTDMNVALIPHVVWNSNDDREAMEVVYNKYHNSNRVIKINDCNCQELKGYISRCRFFVGARTHATIAAYSTGVPTLVLGYSIKSKGIAKDLFGTYENYVVPINEMVQEDEMVNAFIWIKDNEEMIRNRLLNIMPGYKKKIEEAINALNIL